MADEKITLFTELAEAPADSDVIAIVDISDTTDASSGTTKKITIANLLANAGTSEWNSYSAVTPTRASADDPTYVLTFAGVDLTGILGVGMRIKWTQNSIVRYAMVTAISFSTNTTLTVYGGTDYDVEDTGTYPISDFYYSSMKAPLGFPLAPAKWTVEVTDTTKRTQSTPTQNQWYNSGSLSIDIPIGEWDVSYTVELSSEDTVNTPVTVFSTLSTANNTESDADFTTYAELYTTTSDTKRVRQLVRRDKPLTLLVKDTYYMNHKTDRAGISSIELANDLAKMIIRARFAYL